MLKTLRRQVIEKARTLSKMRGPASWRARERHECAVVCPTDSGAEALRLGALIAAADQITNDLSRADELAISAVRPLYGSATLVNVNDARGHEPARAAR